MAVGRFSQRIELEGIQQILRGLADIGQAGSAAFRNLSTAAQSVNPSLAAVSRQVETVRSQLTAFGGDFRNAGGHLASFASSAARVAANVGVPLTLSLGAAAAAVIQLGRSAARLGGDLSDTSQAIGLSVEKLQLYRFAASQAGVSSEQFANAMTRLSSAVDSEAQKQRETISKISQEIAKALDARRMRGIVENPFYGGVQAVQSYTDILRNLGPVVEQVRQDFERSGIRLSAGQATAILQDLIRTSSDVRKYLSERGVPTASQSFLEAINRNAGDANNALKRLGVSVLDAQGQLRPMEDILGDIMDRFKAMPEGAEKVSIAAQLLGRRIGGRLLPFLNQGREGLLELTDELRKMGIILDGGQVKRLDDMGDAFERVGFVVEGIKGQLGSIFAEPLTQVADEFSRSIARNSKALKEWAADLGRRAIPVFEDFIKMMRGASDTEIKTKWLIDLREGIFRVGQAFENAFRLIILPGLQKAQELLGTVAAAVNRLFGTRFTGNEIGIAILVGHFTGLNGAIKDVVFTVGILTLAFARLGATPLGIALIGLAAAAALATGKLGTVEEIINRLPAGIPRLTEQFKAMREEVQRNPNATGWDQFVAFIKADLEAAKRDAQRFWEDLTFFGNAFVDAAAQMFVRWGENIRAMFDSVISHIVGKVQQAISLFDRLRGAGSGAAAAGGSVGGNSPGNEAAPFAGGGRVWGPGTSTSDSILARLSRGEFVIKAAAVNYYGPQLMAALNAMRLPRFPSFNAGGLLDGLSSSLARNFAIPGFADGGLALAGATGRPVVIHLPGGGQIEGFTATPSAVDALVKYSVGAQVRSGGKKPSWYR